VAAVGAGGRGADADAESKLHCAPPTPIVSPPRPICVRPKRWTLPPRGSRTAATVIAALGGGCCGGWWNGHRRRRRKQTALPANSPPHEHPASPPCVDRRPRAQLSLRHAPALRFAIRLPYAGNTPALRAFSAFGWGYGGRSPPLLRPSASADCAPKEPAQ
jgi:hypothetical protein